MSKRSRAFSTIIHVLRARSSKKQFENTLVDEKLDEKVLEIEFLYESNRKS
jgi:hypothetical protein